MEGPSIYDKIRSYRRMLNSVGTEPPAGMKAMPVEKPKGTKRVPTRDPATGKIIWKDVPDE